MGYGIISRDGFFYHADRMAKTKKLTRHLLKELIDQTIKELDGQLLTATKQSYRQKLVKAAYALRNVREARVGLGDKE